MLTKEQYDELKHQRNMYDHMRHDCARQQNILTRLEIVEEELLRQYERWQEFKASMPTDAVVKAFIDTAKDSDNAQD